MGCGKSTVGKRLAKKLNLSFIDLDIFIENRFHKTISQLFAEKGEETFRIMEHNVLQEVCAFENVVIATGGGAACFHNNMALMNQSGTTVYLQASVAILTGRLNRNKAERPLLSQKNDEELHQFITETLAKREPFYLQAQVIVDNIRIHDFSVVNELAERFRC